MSNEGSIEVEVALEGLCPFCTGEYKLGRVPPPQEYVLLHSAPACAKYMDLSMLAYVQAVGARRS